MRNGVRFSALGCVLAGVLVALPAATAGVAAASPQPDHRQATPHVELLSSVWSVESTPQEMEVRATYPPSTPTTEYVGKPTEIQIMRSDGAWETVGSAEQQQVDEKPETVTAVDFVWPQSGRLRIRALAHTESDTYQSESAVVDVRAQTPRFNPTALPNTGEYCGEPTIAGARRIAYACAVTYAAPIYTYNHMTGERKRVARASANPDFADRANVLIADKVRRGATAYSTRRIDLDTSKAQYVTRKRDDSLASTDLITPSSVSANGRRVAYVSEARGIVRNAPKGSNIYLWRLARKRSQLLEHGDSAAISGNGRFVAWRDVKSKRVRRTNVKTGRTVTLPGSRLRGYNFIPPSINASGRYVVYEHIAKGKHQIRLYDASSGKTRVLGRGRQPVIAANGSRIAFKRSANVYVWSQATGASTLVSKGMVGDGSKSWNEQIDISRNGRWVIALSDSPYSAPDNGRFSSETFNHIVLYDLKTLGG